MDLKTPDPLTILKKQGLARPWDFSGKSGFKLTPKTAVETAQLLHWAQETETKIALNTLDASRMEEPLWLDYSELKQIRKYPVDDFIIQVETGMTFGELSAHLSPKWQAFPLSYPSDTLIGEVLAEDRPALETGLKGYPRDYVLKVEIATPDGQLSISGADVVKNVTGYDLAKLYVSGRHTFGVLTSVTLKLAAAPQNSRQWLYESTSYNEASALSERLLASKLPMSICELYQDNSRWNLLIEIAGDDWVQVECQTVLNQLGNRPSQPLSEEEGASLIDQLQRYDSDVTIVEAALPFANWLTFSAMLLKQSALANMRIQVRPAAGLVYIFAPFFPFTALRYLKAETEKLQGTLQLLQVSKTDAVTLYEAGAVYEEFNLPTDPTVQRLLKDLKKGYDPNGILFTPRLPL